MTRYHLGIFINVEFLVWLDSPLGLEFDGKVPRENIDHKLSYECFYVLGFIISISGKSQSKILNCIRYML